MARRVFLHIGTMKSATTWLQGMAFANSDRLAQQGVFWPVADQRALADFLGRDEARTGHEGAWPELVGAIQRHPGDAVWSNELLAPLGAGKIKRLVAAMQPAHVEVVVTARDLGRVIPSHWQTTLQNGSTTKWSDFAAAVCTEPAQLTRVPRSEDVGSWFWRRHDIPTVLARWQPFVPAKQMTVVTVPPVGSDPQIVVDRFAMVVGINASGLEQPPHGNSSVGAYSAELLRRLNEVVPDLERHHYRFGVKKVLTRTALMGRAAQEPRFTLTEEHRRWVDERAGRMIDEIQASGVRVVGDLDDLRPAPQVSPHGVDPSSASEADLLEAALQGLGEMAKFVGDQQLELERHSLGGTST